MDTDITEEEFLKQYDPNKYARPSVATDAIVFSYFDERLHVLLVRRKNHPFRGRWVFPGGFVEVYEDPDETVRRELREETGLEADFLAHLAVFGRPDRDPRYHVISVAYFGVVRADEHVPNAADDAAEAAWFHLSDVPPLGFDHGKILEVAVERLKQQIRYPSFALEFFGSSPTGGQLRGLYEAVLGERLDRQRFLRRLGRFCLEKPKLTAPLKISRRRLDEFEATIGAWWL